MTVRITVPCAEGEVWREASALERIEDPKRYGDERRERSPSSSRREVRLVPEPLRQVRSSRNRNRRGDGPIPPPVERNGPCECAYTHTGQPTNPPERV